MSVESAKAILEKIKNDSEFGAQLEAESDETKRIQFMKDAGFDFTKEEFKQAAKEMAAAAGISDELSDDELEAVAGGSSAVWVGTGAAVVGAAAGAAAAAAF